jgi:hypothetical protein
MHLKGYSMLLARDGKLLVLFVFLNIPIFIGAKDVDYNKFVIGHHKAGFFSDFLGVLNHLFVCDIQGKTPVVYWDERFNYYQADYKCCPNCKVTGQNAWDYYFNPVSDLVYNHSDVVCNKFWSEEIPHEKQFFTSFLDLGTRRRAKQIIDKYISIKPCIQKKIDVFYSEKMQGKRVIGLHLRGTDKFTEVKPVSLSIIIEEANKYAGLGTCFFVATDEGAILNKAKQELKGEVIYWDSYRWESNQSPLPDRDSQNGGNYPRGVVGEQILIEVQLLSRCDKLLHTLSNVSTAALFFNPDLDNVLFKASK